MQQMHMAYNRPLYAPPLYPANGAFRAPILTTYPTYPAPFSLPAMPTPPRVQPSPTPRASIPSLETTNNNLSTSKGVQVGMKNGLIFSLLAGIPIWGIEYKFKKTNFIQDLLVPIEQAFRSGNKEWTEALKKPTANFISSLTGTALIGVTAGAFLGSWIVSRTKKRLVEINQVAQEQQQGTFQPKTLSWKQKLGLEEPPVEKPNDAYQNLLQNNLNSGHAFKQGALAVLFCKVLPALVSTAIFFAGIGTAKLMGKQQLINALFQTLNLEEKEFVRLMFHPVVLAKTAALPIMGGFIAQQTVPWMRNQLGIKDA